MRDASIRCFYSIVIVGLGTTLSAQPTFDLSWRVPSRIDAQAGDLVEYDAVGIMTPGGELGGSGAQGWSMSCTAEGWAITDITTDGTTAADVSMGGLRNTGFEISEITSSARPGSACEGSDGAVSAVVLSFVMEITWPTDEPSDVIVVHLEGSAPSKNDESISCSISFTDGCQGSGQPVDNRVTHRGNTIIPSPGTGTTTINTIIIDDFSCPRDGEVAIVLSDSGSPIQSPDFTCTEFEHLQHVFARPGEIPEAEVFVALSSNGAGSGVQGWSLAASITGGTGAVVREASVAGTVADDAAAIPGGLRNTGFEISEIIDPELEPSSGPLAGQGPQGHGVITATVLSFVTNITLDPTGTATVLRLRLSPGEALVEGPSRELGIFWRDGLQGSGQPVNNVFTISGNTVRPFGCQSGRIIFGIDDSPGFLRCDANSDGGVDIADAVWIVNELFRQGPTSSCENASDCNDDGRVDVSDATFCLAFRFLRGTPPPPPFPECGLDDDVDDLVCAQGGCD
jgi:hypothetical protein